MLLAGLVSALSLAGCGTAGSAPARQQAGLPKRVVSMNPCIDAVLHQVAAPGQIASVSYYSHDPRATSVPLDWARRFPSNDGSAEAIILAQPDLVIAGAHVSVQTIRALERLGIPLLRVQGDDSIAGHKAQIAQIAQALGRVEAGRILNARIDGAIAQSGWTGEPVSALVWQGGGLVPGRGTLVDELLTRTGFANQSSALGLAQWDILPLEAMLENPPDVLLSGAGNMGESEAETRRMLGHRVLHKARDTIRQAPFPSRLINCGGPVIIPALEHLAAVRRSVEARP